MNGIHFDLMNVSEQWFAHTHKKENLHEADTGVLPLGDRPDYESSKRVNPNGIINIQLCPETNK